MKLVLLEARVLKSTLVQVMAWCHQATSHNLSQCWPRSMSPYGVTRPQWVNIFHACLFTGRFSMTRCPPSCLRRFPSPTTSSRVVRRRGRTFSSTTAATPTTWNADRRRQCSGGAPSVTRRWPVQPPSASVVDTSFQVVTSTATQPSQVSLSRPGWLRRSVYRKWITGWG